LDAGVMEKHTWLKNVYDLRTLGILPKEYYDRDVVILDFRFCDRDFDPYYVMRREMKWLDYFGDGLDALWDILTGMPFFGDDFIIKRFKKHSYTDKYGEHDYTHTVDGISRVFERAIEEYGKYTGMTVKIEYCD
jgi:RNAse (barnase) inhibitor barstar